MPSEFELFLGVKAATLTTAALVLQILIFGSVISHNPPVGAAIMTGYSVATVLYTFLAAKKGSKIFTFCAIVNGACATLSILTYFC